jgi:hypothetical protein
MTIVIFGIARSGTSALFYKIKHALPPDTVCLFEPRSFDQSTLRKRRIASLLTAHASPMYLLKFYCSVQTTLRRLTALPISKDKS